MLAACWSYTRRRFYEVAQATNARVTETLRRIAELYAVEAEVRGQSAALRLAERRNRSKLIVDAMRLWSETQVLLVPGRSTPAEAIRYALSRWEGLTRFLQDGCIELDTNPVERAIRSFALGSRITLLQQAGQRTIEHLLILRKRRSKPDSVSSLPTGARSSGFRESA